MHSTNDKSELFECRKTGIRKAAFAAVWSTFIICAAVVANDVPESFGVISASAAETETPEARILNDTDYPELLEGDLTKEQFEVVLSYAPSAMSSGEMTAEDLVDLLDNLAMDAMFDVRYSGDFNSFIGVDGWRWEGEDVDDIYYSFNLSQLDRFISVLTDPLTQEMLNRGTRWDPTISQDTLSIYIGPGDGGYHNTATITDSILIENYAIAVTYEVVSKAATVNNIVYDEIRTAILIPSSDGKYRISEITGPNVRMLEGDGWSVDLYEVRQQESGTANESSQDAEQVRESYEEILNGIANGQYDFTYSYGEIQGHEYFITDMNGDGVPELVVCEIYWPESYIGVGVFNWRDCRVFTAVPENGSWTVKALEGECDIIAAYSPADGNGFYAQTDFGRASGIGEYHRVIIRDDVLTMESEYETYSMADDTQDAFETENPPVTWHDISDSSGLDDLDLTGESEEETKETSESSQEEEAVSYEGCVFPDSSTRLLDESEITVLSDTDLTYAINEIYARHGYIFSTPELLEHFQQFDWYEETVPGSSFDDSVFNEIEHENVQLLAAERDRR